MVEAWELCEAGTHHALDVLTRRVAMLLEGAAGAYDRRECRAMAVGRRQLGDLAPRGGSVCASVRGGGAPPQLVRWTDSVVGRPGGFDAPLFVGVPCSAEVTGDANAAGRCWPHTVIWLSRVGPRPRLAHPASRGEQRSERIVTVAGCEEHGAHRTPTTKEGNAVICNKRTQTVLICTRAAVPPPVRPG